jgi:membrane protease YdiL (CAAX protease family)
MGYARRMRSAWLTDIRKLALLNCIFSFLAALVPAERLVVPIDTIKRNHPDWSVLVMLALVALMLVAVLFLTFFWALYRDRAAIILPAHLRLIALGAAVVLLLIGFRTLWGLGFRHPRLVIRDAAGVAKRSPIVSRLA